MSMGSLHDHPSCPGLGVSAPEQGGGKAPFKTTWKSSNQTNLPLVWGRVSMSNCSLLNWARNSIEVATGKMQLGVAPPESWGLVWCRQPEERERTRDSTNLGEMVVLEQDLDLESHRSAITFVPVGAARARSYQNGLPQPWLYG